MPIITLSPPSPPPHSPLVESGWILRGSNSVMVIGQFFCSLLWRKLHLDICMCWFFFFFWQIMDEADRILNLDFEKEVGKLCKHINSKWLWNVVSSQSAVKWQLMNYGNCQIWSDGSTRMSNPNFRAKVSQVWKM